MKKLLFLIPILLFITACADDPISIELPAILDDHTLPSDQAHTPAPQTFEDDPLTIFVPTFTIHVRQENEAKEMANRLLQDAGLNIEFARYNPYQIRPLLEAGGGNHVFVANQQRALLLYQEGLIGNFYEQSLNAPRYREEFSHKITNGTMFHVPIRNSRTVYSPMLLIRNEIYHEWGQPVNSVQDYEELLNWLRDRGDRNPGLFALNIDTWRGNELGYMPLMLFLADSGYSPLTGMFHQTSGISTPLWINNESGDISPFYNIPSAVDAFVRLIEWRDTGLIEIWGSQENEISEFSTILFNSTLYGFNSMEIDISEYTVIFFPPVSAVIIDSSGYAGGAVAAPDTDIEMFFRFLEWLTFPENYVPFMYGVEDVDHLRNDNGYITGFLDSVYSDWQGNFFFWNSAIVSQVFYSSPSWIAFDEKIDNIPDPVFPLNWDTRFDIGYSLITDSGFPDAINNHMASRMEILYLRIIENDANAIEAREAVEDIFSQIRAIPGLDLAERLVRERMGE